MVMSLTKAASTVREIVSVFCCSMGIVLLLFGGILFVNSHPAWAGTGTNCGDRKPKNCPGGVCLASDFQCTTTSGGQNCACV
jgi:hypothetical protein